MSDTIRLFIGTSPNGEDYEAEAVAEFTARSNSSLPIDITWMRQAKSGPYSGWNCATQRTPFSHFRWSPPAVSGFAGRAIYSDVDFIFRGDLAELWRQDIPGVLLCRKSKKPGGKIKTCCMLFDCAKAKGHVPDLDGLRKMDDPQGRLSNYFMQTEGVAHPFEGGWNTIDPDEKSMYGESVKAIHFSRMQNQMHLAHAVPRLKKQGQNHWYNGDIFPHENAELIRLFDSLLTEAQAAGLTYESYGYGGGVPIVRKNFTYSVNKGVGA